MRYLVAFDKFKGALSAHEAVRVGASAIAECDPGAQVAVAPLTDGGEGFAAILAEALEGKLVETTVPGPRFAPVKGRFALIPGGSIPDPAWTRLQLADALRNEIIGIVEMASASGYEQLRDDQRDPWRTSTIGTGMLMREAVKAGARAIILGIGGSATNDCGAGALEALGVVYYDRDLQPVGSITPEAFKRVTSAGSMSHLLDSFPPVRIACDVTNPLLGENGATRVFGPQKGLKPEDTDQLERNVRKMATRILGLFGREIGTWDELMAEPGAGAAGGIGFALRHALPDSKFVEGFPLVSELMGIPDKIAAADCLVTGEGRIDASSLSGKGPVGLVRLAGSKQKVFILAGKVDTEPAEAIRKMHPNLLIEVISDPDWPLEKALAETGSSLRRAVQRLLAGTE